MTDPDYRIPDDMAAEVLAESARLYAEANKGYSFADLQQACADIQIPPYIVKQAISNVEEKRSSDRLKRQQLRDYLKAQIDKGTSIGVALLVPAIAVASIFIFRHQLKPAIGGMISYLNPQPSKAASRFKNLTVEKGKLIYLADPQGLSISVSRAEDNAMRATIGTDGYNNFEICPANDDEISIPKPALDSCHSGKLGGSYEYQGLYDYRIKIIEIKYDSVVFQIEQISNEPKSALSQSQEEVKQLQKDREQAQIQIKESQIRSKKLQERIEEFRKALSQSQQEVEQLPKDREKAQLQIEESQIRSKELQERVEEFREALSQSQEEVKQLLKNREKAQLQIEESQIQIKEFQVQIKRLEDHIKGSLERENKLERPL